MTVSNDKLIKLWCSITGEHLRDIAGHKSSVLSASWSPDSSMIVSCQNEMPLIIWNADDASGVRNLDANGVNKASQVEWSGDGRLICSAGRDGSLRTWGLFSD